MKVIIIGAGRVGSSLGYLFKKAGLEIVGVCNQHLKSSQKVVELIGTGQPLNRDDLKKMLKKTDLVLITTPDDQIKKMAEFVLTCEFKRPIYMLHTSGLQESTILNEQHESGVYVFSMHPLQAIPDFNTGIKLLPRSVFTIEGCSQGEIFAQKLAEKLNLTYYSIDKKHKPLYHAAAVIASNYLVTLIEASYHLLKEAKMYNSDIQAALLNLVRGTLQNLENKPPREALTGPIARGDLATIQSHLEVLKKEAPANLQLYKVMGEYTARLAGQKDMFARIFNQ